MLIFMPGQEDIEVTSELISGKCLVFPFILLPALTQDIILYYNNCMAT